MSRPVRSRRSCRTRAEQARQRQRRPRRAPPRLREEVSPSSSPPKIRPPGTRRRTVGRRQATINPSVRPRSSSSSCAPCARHNARRVRASSRIRAAPAPRAVRRPPPRGASASSRSHFGARRLIGDLAGGLRRLSSARLRARSSSRRSRASRIALRSASRWTTAGSFGSYFGRLSELFRHGFAGLAAAA